MALTKADKKFLTETFVTKKDLQKGLKDQTDDIVSLIGEYVADVITPMFDQRDKKITRIEKKLNLTPLAD